MKAQTHLRRSNRGVAAVELALLIIPLVMMVLAAIDFARAMFVYDQLVKSVRDGARYLSFFDPTLPGEYPVDLVKNRILRGSASGSGPVIVPGLTAGMISICDQTNADACPGESFANIDTGSGSINLVKVQITGYRFTPVFPGASKLVSVPFDPISATMRQLY